MTETRALRALWLVGSAENTTVPDPEQGSRNVVGIDWVSYFTKVTFEVPAVVEVTKLATIFRPRDPV